MPKTPVIPEGTGKPLAPYLPGVLADGVVYVSGTLPFDKENNVVHVGDAAGADQACARDHQVRHRDRGWHDG